jgi:hypothetical protein
MRALSFQNLTQFSDIPDGMATKYYYKAGFKGKGKILTDEQRAQFESKNLTCGAP